MQGPESGRRRPVCVKQMNEENSNRTRSYRKARSCGGLVNYIKSSDFTLSETKSYLNEKSSQG